MLNNVFSTIVILDGLQDETTEIADSTTETPPISSTTTSTSTSSSTSTITTNDWVLFLEHLDPLDRLDLIRAVFSYLLS